MFDSSQWVLETLARHSTDIRQFLDFRQSTLPNGMRIVDAYNGSGLHFTILPDRGFDIWSAHYKGIPLTWISKGSPYIADAARPWLEQFNGGMMATCGLTHAGPPEVNPETGEKHGLHGKFSQLRAGDLTMIQDQDGTLRLQASVHQGVMFHEQITLEREYELPLHKATITVRDRVTNHGDETMPLMLVYHCNFGYPLIRAGTELLTASIAYPRDEPARTGYSTRTLYEAPIPQYAEQVFFHHVGTLDDNIGHAALVNGDFGLALRWDTGQLPYLTQWKNTREGIYVSGIEPGNCIPEGQQQARKHGRLHELEPGETFDSWVAFDILDGDAVVNEYRSMMQTLQASGTPVKGCHLDDFAGKDQARG